MKGTECKAHYTLSLEPSYETVIPRVRTHYKNEVRSPGNPLDETFSAEEPARLMKRVSREFRSESYTAQIK